MEALLLPILLIAVFYFLLIRPQQRQRRQMQQMQQTLAVGNKVMTGSGLIATVASIDDDEVELEVAPGVTNTYVRRAIINVLDGQQNEEASDADPLAADESEFSDSAETDGDAPKHQEANDSESR
ncbi:preprotein translocase subunit YajC [Actinobacteria bacterium YIM 96077]|uniref:Preprotein translocase subunit YajC n=1 Tax=Phytoactinopolyspora halophila TaxID=1981511 RepID=A0A329QK32_9ACTN|nr:preprotein translocase subunit YajC [Phytoactinopolyspora halophila]AYY13465.1 preprotein translocase subunit YajC [Actinobacteria bacterium YIM 96077]RAW10858.1 preprotein translocase subunit YajC [Phytoactinopolyspora halophila]